MSDYVLGNTEAEHERLVRQAASLAPFTERFFRDAGIGPGQRVVDLGSGVGDVALLAPRLVGPSGEVVGIERDALSIAKARARLADARSVSELVRPGGVVAFQEPSFAPVLLHSTNLPLWSTATTLLDETFHRAGANAETGPALYEIFQVAGLPAPSIRTESLPDTDQWMVDVLRTLRPKILECNLPLASLGDLDTLLERLRAEVLASNAIAPSRALVGVWSRKPTSQSTE